MQIQNYLDGLEKESGEKKKKEMQINEDEYKVERSNQ